MSQLCSLRKLIVFGSAVLAVLHLTLVSHHHGTTIKLVFTHPPQNVSIIRGLDMPIADDVAALRAELGKMKAARAREDDELKAVPAGLQPQHKRTFETTFIINALYSDDTSYKDDCCLSNTFMFAITRLAQLCTASLAMKNTVVVLPPDLDTNGGFRSRNKLELFNESAITKLVDLALTFGCTVIDHAAASSAGINKTYFATKDADMKMMDSGPYLQWFFRNMQLPPVLHSAVGQCFSKEVVAGKPYVAVHLRIEDDWQSRRSPNKHSKGHKRISYCKQRPILAERKGGEPIKACYSPKEIAVALLEGKLVPKLSAETHVLIYGDPAPQFAKGTGGHPLEVWPIIFPLVHVEHKDPGCSRSLKALTYNERAFVDMWIASKATHFVGIMTSTFSNAVTQVRHINDQDSSFAYSCSSIAPLIPRFDYGERQGGTDAEACRIAAGVPPSI